jgi:hypothetical protein
MIPKTGQWAVLRHPLLPQYACPRPVEVVGRTPRRAQVLKNADRSRVTNVMLTRVMAAFNTQAEAERFCAAAFALRVARDEAERAAEHTYNEAIAALLRDT